MQETSTERDLILVPRSAPPRKVGPGRLERGYLARVEALERGVQEALGREQALTGDLARAQGALEVAGRLERGLQRLADRQEERIDALAQRESRLVLAMGALQRENELLKAELGPASSRATPAIEGAAGERIASRPRRRPARQRAPTGFWARLLRRSGPTA